MIAPLLAVLLQAADVAPVNVWVDSSSPLARGSSVRVYVEAAADGNLVVLQRRTDGRITALFPASPADAPLVRAGTYAMSFVVSEPDGTGMILAALSSDPVRFDEFTRAVDWNPEALVPSWGDADAEGALSDIVQRMLGGGYFNYDVVTYSVAPAVYAQQDMTPESVPYPSCLGCTFIGVQLISAEPFFTCDAFFEPCLGFRRFRRHASSCSTRSRCLEPSTRTIALAIPARTRARPAQGNRQLAIPNRGGSSPPIEPRRQPSNTRTRRHAAAPVTRSASPAPAAPRRHVRFTRLSPPVRDEPQAAGNARRGVQLVAAARGAVIPSRGAAPLAVAMAETWRAMPQPLARSSTSVGVAGATRPARTIALSGAVRHGTGVRVGPAHAARRR